MSCCGNKTKKPPVKQVKENYHYVKNEDRKDDVIVLKPAIRENYNYNYTYAIYKPERHGEVPPQEKNWTGVL
jgi:hypothetical protein